MEKIQAQLEQLLSLQKDILSEQEKIKLEQMNTNEQIEYLKKNNKEIKDSIDTLKFLIAENEKRYEVI